MLARIPLIVSVALTPDALAQSGPPVCAFEQAHFGAAAGAVGDEFGLAVALDLDTAVVGSHKDDQGAADAGAVHVFARSGGAWGPQGKLVASDAAPNDQFGHSVAVDGDTVVVGSWRADSAGVDSGAAYVFVRGGGAWTQQAKLVAFDGAGGDLFGGSVAVDGDTAVVGSLAHAGSGISKSGAVYVFVRNGASWSFEAKLEGSLAATGDSLGSSVSLDGDRLLAGAGRGDGVVPDTGVAYVFDRAGAIWTESAVVRALDGAAGDAFGGPVSCSLDGDRAVVGARLDADFGAGSGSAYVFERGAGAWGQVQKLNASNAAAGDEFGRSVSLDGERLAVSAWFRDGVASNGGAAYQFSRVGGAWAEDFEVAPAGVVANAQFGESVSLSGATLLGGGRYDGNPVNGSAFAFVALPGPATYCSAKLNSCGALPAIGFLGSSSASASLGFHVTATGTRAGRFGLLMYSDAGPATPPIPFAGGFLCVNPAPLKRSIPVADLLGTPGQCDGSFALDMNAFAAGALGGQPLPALRQPGVRIDCQYWGRDTVAHGSLLTDALQFHVCP